MGDVVHTLPAVYALREEFPRAHIGWLIEERWAELLCAPGAARRGARSALRPLVDEVHAVSLKAWRKSLFSISALQRAATVWNDVRDAGYDVAVDLQGAMRSAVLARLSGAGVVYGAFEPREAPASLWYTRKVIARGRHVVEQNLSVAEAITQEKLAAPRIEFPIDPFPIDPFPIDPFPVDPFPVDARVEERTERDLEQHGVGEFALLNPGAGWGAKRWPTERYGEVARGLARAGLCPMVNYGPGEEDLFRAVLAASGGAARPTKGSVTELIALTRRARIFIGGDTGPLHLAAALRVPVVAIFGPTDPARNGPYGTRSVVLRSAESVTSHARRADAEVGMLGIGSDAVVEAAHKLLGGGLRG